MTFDMFRGSREHWIRHALSIPFSFPHRARTQLHWVPLASIDESVLGLLQKTRKHERHRPPHEGGEEIVEDEWQGAYVLVDPTHHDEGQRVAVENDVVGEPQALLKSLVSAMNSMAGTPYHVEIEPLFDAREFWVFAEQHGNAMRYINFDFVVPNMWTPHNDLELDLRDTGAETGAQRVKVGFASEDGVRANAPRIRRGVDYAEKGAGTLSAKSMDGARFHSTKTAKTTMAPIVIGALTFALFASMKERILGRGKARSVADVGGGFSDPRRD